MLFLKGQTPFFYKFEELEIVLENKKGAQSLNKTNQKSITVSYFLCVDIFLGKNDIGTILWTTMT